MAQYKLTGWSAEAMAKSKLIKNGVHAFAEIEFPIVVSGDYLIEIDADGKQVKSDEPIVFVNYPKDQWSLWWFQYEPIV